MIALRKPEVPPVDDASRPFLAFVGDEATAQIVRAAAGARDLPEDGIVIGSLDDAVDGLAGIRTPSLLIVDLGASRDVMVEAERLSQVCDPDADVILLGAVNDMILQRDLIAAGVGDYIVKPFDVDDLSRAIKRLQPPPAPKRPDAVPLTASACEAIAVIGVRGGVGASTLAAGLAWIASHDLARKTTLVDLDLTFGTQALILDIDPGNGLCDAMQEPGRMDELFVKRASTTVDPMLSVIAAETDTGRGDIASASAFAGLYEFLAAENALVVADVPRGLAVAQPDILHPFARIILVAEPTLPAVRDTARLAAHLALRASGARVGVVLGRAGMSAKEELSKKAFEDGAGVKVAATLPFDPKAALSAEGAGKCVAQGAKRTKLGRAIADAVPVLLGLDAKQSGPGLGAMLKMIGRKTAKENGDVRQAPGA